MGSISTPRTCRFYSLYFTFIHDEFYLTIQFLISGGPSAKLFFLVGGRDLKQFTTFTQYLTIFIFFTTNSKRPALFLLAKWSMSI